MCDCDNVTTRIMIVFFIAIFYFVYFFFQAEDGIRDLVRSRGLGDVYKRQDIRLPKRKGPPCCSSAETVSLSHAYRFPIS